MPKLLSLLLFLIPVSGLLAERNTVTFRSDGNAVFAVDADGQPVWSKTGLLFQERYSSKRSATRFSKTSQPFRDDVPMVQRFGRLHVILEKSPEATGSNVLVSLDLATQGKLVFRRDSGRTRFVRFVSLLGDTLTVECADGATLSLDVAVGE